MNRCSDAGLRSSASTEPYSAGHEKMSLEMKRSCEKCGRTLVSSAVAYICSYECTYCGGCAEELNCVCPNCGGELVPRPRGKESTSSAVADA